MMSTVTVDYTKIIGKIKPMHAVNNVPCVPYDANQNNLFQKMKEAGIPYSRLHDTGGRYGGSRYVDIANIFPDFEADENNPDSYDFTFTDRLLEEMVRFGVKPFYRLGTTIENFHFIKAYHINPPRDFGKWARICEKIIAHYNEGWNNGYYFDIRYWEIWNEPDNMTTAEENPMWKGSPQQFYEFYTAVSRYLKQCFPEIKIGGYGSCGFYALSNADYSETAHSSSRVDYFIEFFLGFLEYISANGGILDFFSWHSYANIRDNVVYGKYAREKLNQYGYRQTEIFLNEWNPGIEQIGRLKDASNILSGMCLMQNTPVDMCMYYDVQINTVYCGLFNMYTHDVFKAYYSFYAFNRLYRLENQVESRIDAENVYVCAAGKGEERGLLIVNNADTDVCVNIVAKGIAETNVILYALDKEHDFEQIKGSLKQLMIPESGFVYIAFGKGSESL